LKTGGWASEIQLSPVENGAKDPIGGLEHRFFPDIGNFIIPTDEHIFFRGVG